MLSKENKEKQGLSKRNHTADTPLQDYLLPLPLGVDVSSLPERFTYPFYYEAHPICKAVAAALQIRIEEELSAKHNFGLHPKNGETGNGKMFGVLIVKNTLGELAYLAAFSGKVGGSNDHAFFVPPIFDMLKKGDFFDRGMEHLGELGKEIRDFQNEPVFTAAKLRWETEIENKKQKLAEAKAEMRSSKAIRKRCRIGLESELTSRGFEILIEELKNESLKDHFYFRDLTKLWTVRVNSAKRNWEKQKAELDQLKAHRKAYSNDLQQQLFEKYSFINAEGDYKDVQTIFREYANIVPPSAAGECAAPKLLQFAYLNNLHPVAMAEFWWGKSPNSEIRKHKHFYPSCRGKCEPILGHMLKGLQVDPNPLKENKATNASINILYEDESIAVIEKPAGLLSVPGKSVKDSVATRMKKKYPHATGPVIVHRLDMATSGIMLIAKSDQANKKLQAQFIDRSIKKRYLAVLEGKIEASRGEIDLPIRVDLNDRPRQLVCYEHGKSAKTHWEKIASNDKQTLVYFYPLTGRTHQLRVHASHASGLNTAIKGDELYGSKSERLHLHAQRIEFNHPDTEKRLIFESLAPFEMD